MTTNYLILHPVGVQCTHTFIFVLLLLTAPQAVLQNTTRRAHMTRSVCALLIICHITTTQRKTEGFTTIPSSDDHHTTHNGCHHM